MEISERLEQLITKLGENAASFAEKLGVQRSSLSHLLSGRNKPSVDFLEKLLAVYPSLNITWLITGIGNMMINESAQLSRESDGKKILGQTDEKILEIEPSKINKKSFENQHNMSNRPVKVMLFYANGTFEVYEP